MGRSPLRCPSPKTPPRVGPSGHVTGVPPTLKSWLRHCLISLSASQHREQEGSRESARATTNDQWRRQLWGTGARAPLDFQIWEPTIQVQYCVICEISWCRCQQLTALYRPTVYRPLVKKLLVIEQLLHRPRSPPWVSHNIILVFAPPRNKSCRRAAANYHILPGGNEDTSANLKKVTSPILLTVGYVSL